MTLCNISTGVAGRGIIIAIAVFTVTAVVLGINVNGVYTINVIIVVVRLRFAFVLCIKCVQQQVLQNGWEGVTSCVITSQRSLNHWSLFSRIST